MIFKLDVFATIGILVAQYGAGVPVKAMAPPEPISPVPVIKLLSSLPPITAEPLPTLDFEPFPLAPMGTYGNSYTPRNCTWGVASTKATVPGSWGNANTWDDSARADGLIVSPVPMKGAIAQTDAGYYGHVAAVLDVAPGRVFIEEMNYDYNGGVRTRWAPVGEFVYIYV